MGGMDWLRPKNRTWLIGIAVVMAAVSWWSTGDLLRKNDQASILAGAHDWARGERQAWSRYYQFDKTYVVYAVAAAVLKANRVLDLEWDPVCLANRALASAFWLALFVFTGRYRASLSPPALLAVLTAPAVLFNTQYVNSSVLSSAFLLLCFVALPRPEEERPRPVWPAALWFFLATGARADAVLLLPLVVWLLTPFPMLGKTASFFSKAWKRGRQNVPTSGTEAVTSWREVGRLWRVPGALVAAALAALVLGRVWSDAPGTALDPFFNRRMAAGYLVFGFGAAGLYYVWQALALGLRIRRADGGWARGYALAGLLAFLLPVVFFLPQLHAPRYFWRGCEAVLLLAVWWPDLLRTGWLGRWCRPLVVLAAVVPLGFGLYLPTPDSPRWTRGEATRFPSGDGHYPMGAYGAFLGAMRRGSEVPIDHNQRVWRAVQSAEFRPAADGSVPVLATPMYGYFLLGASLQGLWADCGSYDRLAGRPFYMDSRTLMRRDVKFSLRERESILDSPIEVVSEDIEGIAVLRVGRGDQRWGQQTRLLNRLFEGNEYRVGGLTARTPADRTMLWFGPDYFSWAQQDEATGWYYRSSPATGHNVRKAWSALPAWMTVQSFQE